MATGKAEQKAYGVEVRAEKAAPAGDKTLKRVEIERSDNGGFIVRCFHEMKTKKGARAQGMFPSAYMEPEMYTFTTKEAMDAYTDSLFGIEDSKTEAPKAKAKDKAA